MITASALLIPSCLSSGTVPSRVCGNPLGKMGKCNVIFQGEIYLPAQTVGGQWVDTNGTIPFSRKCNTGLYGLQLNGKQMSTPMQMRQYPFDRDPLYQNLYTILSNTNISLTFSQHISMICLIRSTHRLTMKRFGLNRFWTVTSDHIWSYLAWAKRLLRYQHKDISTTLTTTMLWLSLCNMRENSGLDKLVQVWFTYCTIYAQVIASK